MSIAQQKFKLPNIPESILLPEGRAVFLAIHYWDNYTFDNTYVFEHKDVLLGYIYLINTISVKAAKTAIISTLEKASGNELVLMLFLECFDGYLFNINSVFMDTEKYLTVVDYIINSKRIDEINKVRFRFQRDIIMKNRVGEVTTDFTFTLRDGTQKRLFDIKLEYTLLLFYNPNCGHCEVALEKISKSPLINRLIDDKRLTLIAIYPYEDINLWSKTALPVTWINGYDGEGYINSRNLYYLRELPSIYLLDSNHKVILKEVKFDVAEKRLYELVHTR